MKERRKRNPYDPARLTCETFVGRKKLLEKLTAGLKEWKSFELIGPVRIGKTSVLLQLHRQLVASSHKKNRSPMPLPIYVSCDDCHASVDTIVTTIINAVSDAFHEVHNKPCPASVRAGAQRKAECGELTEALESLMYWAFNPDHRTYRVVLLLDALHRISGLPVLPALTAKLYTPVDRHHMTVLLTSRTPLIQEKELRDDVSRLLDLLTMRFCIEPFTRDETNALVKVARQDGWEVQPGCADVAHDLSGGHPYILQFLLRAAISDYGVLSAGTLSEAHAQNASHLDKLLADFSQEIVPGHAAGVVDGAEEEAAGPKGRLPRDGLTTVTSVQAARSKQEIADEVIRLLSSMDSLSIDDHRVIGNYVRFDPGVANKLRKDAKRITDACRSRSVGYHNFLIWGSSGEGKTYFAIETATAAGINYKIINLARATDVPDEATFKNRLAAVKAEEGPYLCILDECDKRQTDPWVCAALFDYLSFESGRNGPNAQGIAGWYRKWIKPIFKKTGLAGNKVFILIGSTGDSVESFWSGMRKIPAGRDLETRIPPPPIIIPETTMGDRLLVIFSQIRRYAKDKSRRIERVEKLALAYILLSAKGSKPRGIEEMVMQAVDRLGDADSDLCYGHIFASNEEEEGAFIRDNSQLFDALRGHSLRLK